MMMEEPREVYEAEANREEFEELIEMVNKHSRDIPIMTVDELERRQDGGKVRLKWSMASCVDDFVNVLLVNGYKVSTHIEGELSDEIPIGKMPEAIAVIEFEKVR